MRVRKRDGSLVSVSFDEIVQRLTDLAEMAPALCSVDVCRVATTVCGAVTDGIETARLDELAAEAAAALLCEDCEYGALAARLIVSSMHKATSPDPLVAWELMHTRGLLSEEFIRTARRWERELRALLRYERDFDFDYFGVKLLQKQYCTALGNGQTERPQQLWARVALGIWGDDWGNVVNTYELLSLKKGIHASPTLFNAGSPSSQLASCYLLSVEDDLADIFDTFGKMAAISKHGGGLGLAVSRIRGEGARIKGTGGTSDGVVPPLKVINSIINYVNQGGRRKGAVAVYIEPHHADIISVLQLKRPGGNEATRARDIFYAVYASDLFMMRVEADASWSLFSSDTAPGLDAVWGADYESLYLRYEAEGRAVKTLPAREVWFAILTAQQESGTPYVLFKDSCNGKSNQQHLGTIRCSNLCTEILEYTAPDEVAVCNLASVSLPAFWDAGLARFDFEGLEATAHQLALNLDQTIAVMKYPVKEAETSNLRHRPIGLGVQGLADVFAAAGLPWDSPQAAQLNRDIFETLYYAAVRASVDGAERQGAHPSYPGSPASNGKLQPDLWGHDLNDDRHDWTALKARLAESGMRNSLLVAPMPTASTAAVLGNNEAFEPFNSLMFQRRTLAGTFVVVNRHLQGALKARGLWTPAVRDKILAAGGSVQGIPEIPEDLRLLFRTAWELSMKTIIDMSADRGVYVCQSQSLNLWVPRPDFAMMSSMLFHAWRRGLKTGVYYTHTRPALDAAKVTLPTAVAEPACEACSA